MRVLLLAAVVAVGTFATKDVMKQVKEILHNKIIAIENQLSEREALRNKNHDAFETQDAEAGHDIGNLKEEMEDQLAAHEKALALIQSLHAEVSDLETQGSANAASLKETNSNCKKSSDEFAQTSKDLRATIDTLDRAVAVIRRGSFAQVGMKGALTKMIQTLNPVLEAASIDTDSRSKLAALIQSTQSSEEGLEGFGEPEQKAYESQSGGIIGLLEDMKAKAEDELSALQKEQLKAEFNCNMQRQEFTDIAATLKEQIHTKEGEIHDNEDAAATADGARQEAENNLHSTEQARTKASSTEQMQSDRYGAFREAASQELDSSKKAEAALNGDGSFLQVSSVAASDDSDLRKRVVQALRSLARQHHSVELAQIAVRASNDPFGKVKKMIRTLIHDLKKQKEKDAKENAFCVSETGKTKDKEEKTNGKVDKYQARLDKAHASTAKLEGQVSDLMDKSKQLKNDVRENTANRNEANQEYKADLDKSNKLQEQLGTAIKMLEEDDSGHMASVIDMIREIETESTNAEAEATSDENRDAAAFGEFLQSNEIEQARTKATEQAKKQEISRLTSLVEDVQSDVDGAHEELDAVLKYLDKLQGMCVKKPQSFESKMADMQDQIKNLKNVQAMLDNYDNPQELFDKIDKMPGSF